MGIGARTAVLGPLIFAMLHPSMLDQGILAQVLRHTLREASEGLIPSYTGCWLSLGHAIVQFLGAESAGSGFYCNDVLSALGH